MERSPWPAKTRVGGPARLLPPRAPKKSDRQRETRRQERAPSQPDGTGLGLVTPASSGVFSRSCIYTEGSWRRPPPCGVGVLKKPHPGSDIEKSGVVGSYSSTSFRPPSGGLSAFSAQHAAQPDHMRHRLGPPLTDRSTAVPSPFSCPDPAPWEAWGGPAGAGGGVLLPQ